METGTHLIWVSEQFFPIGRGRPQGINPEIDVAAVRRKDDVLIFVGCILHERSFAVRRNVVKHQTLRAVRVTHHSRHIIAVGRDSGDPHVFAVDHFLNGIVLKRDSLFPACDEVRDGCERKNCRRAD